MRACVRACVCACGGVAASSERISLLVPPTSWTPKFADVPLTSIDPCGDSMADELLEDGKDILDES